MRGSEASVASRFDQIEILPWPHVSSIGTLFATSHRQYNVHVLSPWQTNANALKQAKYQIKYCLVSLLLSLPSFLNTHSVRGLLMQVLLSRMLPFPPNYLECCIMALVKSWSLVTPFLSFCLFVSCLQSLTGWHPRWDAPLHCTLYALISSFLAIGDDHATAMP